MMPLRIAPWAVVMGKKKIVTARNTAENKRNVFFFILLKINF